MKYSMSVHRMKSRAFWCHESRLRSFAPHRCVDVIEKMLNSESDEKYLSYATFVLLEKCSTNTEYTRPLFANPLDTFDYQVLKFLYFK
jgi:hypothetical protein